MRPTGDAATLEHRRRHAVVLISRGQSARQVADELGTTVRSVRRWLKKQRESGNAGLNSRPARGRPPKLDADQASELLRLLRLGPRSQGYGDDEWVHWTIVDLIEHRFNVLFHPDYIPRLLERIGGSDLCVGS